MPAAPVRIRQAVPADAPALARIYEWAAHNTTATMDEEARAPDEMRRWMDTHDGSRYPCLVATLTENGEPVGYATLSQYNPKRGYDRSAEVSVYVHPDRHKQGIGAALLAALIEDARARGIDSLVALITADNEPSLRLHRRFGFADVGTLRRVGRKFGRDIDVSFLQLLLEAPR